MSSPVAHTTTPGKSRAIVLLALGLAALSCVILLSDTSIKHETPASMVHPSSAATVLTYFTQCAKESGTCTCVGTVKYGAKDKWATKTVNGRIGCNNGVFGGDPIRGTKKTCICEQKAGRDSPVQPGFVVAFKGEFGKYCTDSSPYGLVTCNADSVGDWEKFTVVDAGQGGKVALKGGRAGLFCTMTSLGYIYPSPNLQCSRKSIDTRGWNGKTNFNVWDMGDGKVALQGSGGFCADEQKKEVKCTRGSAGSWEKFRVEVIHKP